MSAAAPQVSAALLITAVGAVGVLHTMVPDHWLPITVLARREDWTLGETAGVALRAGIGHVSSTLAIAAIAWIAGVAAARRFGGLVDMLAGLALIGFGAWIALAAWREQRAGEPTPPDPSRSQDHQQKSKELRKSRTALILILGSSPMVEGIPAFFAAAKYGAALVLTMSVVFGAATIMTYVVLCVGSIVGLKRVSRGRFERYGEVWSGGFIALVGFVFLAWPVL
ncbi:MAG TPA: hypothetical protein VKS22_15755 [Candidatus Binataceae bacterium]|nr:hypothetical protein [Candidatus Binataceae bacterium]